MVVTNYPWYFFSSFKRVTSAWKTAAIHQHWASKWHLARVLCHFKKQYNILYDSGTFCENSRLTQLAEVGQTPADTLRSLFLPHITWSVAIDIYVTLHVNEKQDGPYRYMWHSEQLRVSLPCQVTDNKEVYEFSFLSSERRWEERIRSKNR